MKTFKKRKPRTSGSELGFDGAHQFGKPLYGDWYETPAWNKLYKRMKSELCLGCGKEKCNCKSKRLTSK